MRQEDWQQLIQFKSEDDLRKEFEQELFSEENQKDVKVNYWRSGGVLKTITYLFLKGIAQIYLLLLNIVPMGFIQYAKGGWLDLKVAELGIDRFKLSRTLGKLICVRDDVSTRQQIKKGTVVQTDSGLKFIIVQDVVFEVNHSEVEAQVIAENPGSIYNVAPETITNMTVHLPGVSIYNPADWLIEPGAEDEDDESLRERYFLKLAEISHGGNSVAYESWARSVPGVTGVWVDQWHPRGQGTVDVWISTIDQVTGDLITQVASVIEIKKPPTANAKVWAAELIPNRWEISIISNRDPELVKKETIEILKGFYYGSQDGELKPIQQGQSIYPSRVTARLINKLDVLAAPVKIPADTLKVEMHQKNSLDEANIIITVERVS